jgi:putative tricarboxylic transport membrane protein
MKIHDAFFGFFFLALGALVLFAIRGYPNIPGQPVGPALFPGLIAIGLCITGTLMVIKGLRNREPTAWFAWEDWIDSPRHVVALCVLLACVVFYIVAANELGFLPTGFLMLVALFKALQVKWGRSDCYSGDSFCLLQTAARSPTLGHSHTLGLVSCSH